MASMTITDTSKGIPGVPLNLPNQPSQNHQSSLADRFKQLASQRHEKMNRAYECARLTIPSLLPEENHKPEAEFSMKYNSLGAQLVNSLGAKLLLALFPANTPFFSVSANEVIVQQLAELELMQGGGPVSVKSKVEEKLWVLTAMIQNHFERIGIRQRAHEIFKTLIVTGDVAVCKLHKHNIKAFNLNNYVVSRDGEGELVTMILRESVSFATLPEEQKELVVKYAITPNEDSQMNPDPWNTQYDLYTLVERHSSELFKVRQEIGSVPVPGTEGFYKSEELPYMALRWNAVLNENYGRGMVEDYLGDLRSLEIDSHATEMITRAVSKVIPLINPNGLTRLDKISRAQPGQWVYGTKDDISFLTVDKMADFQVVHGHAQDLRNNLRAAFLSNSVIQRNAERVTAEEIRTLASELEDGLGGVYSILSQEFQLPLVKLLYAEVKGQLKEMGVSSDLQLGEDLKIVITTGLDALGRGHDAAKLRRFIADVMTLNSPELIQWLKIPDLLKRLGSADGVDTKGLLKTPEERQQEQQAQQQQMAQEQLLSGAASAIPGVAREAMTRGRV